MRGRVEGTSQSRTGRLRTGQEGAERGTGGGSDGRHAARGARRDWRKRHPLLAASRIELVALMSPGFDAGMRWSC